MSLHKRPIDENNIIYLSRNKEKGTPKSIKYREKIKRKRGQVYEEGINRNSFYS